MPALPADFSLLGLIPGIISTPNYVFLQTGSQTGFIDMFIQGATGAPVPILSFNGRGLYSSGGPPSSGIGRSGDFFVDTLNLRFYGPKTTNTGVWPSTYATMSGTQGPAGTAGTAGATGPAGSGVPAGGAFLDILYKGNAGDYQTTWGSVFSLTDDPRVQLPRAFREIYRNLNLLGSGSSSAGASMGSSVTYRPNTNTLYCLDNATPAINEYTIDSKFIRTISLSGFKDCEGIEWMDDDQFAICEEYNSATGSKNEINVVEIPETGSVTIIKGGSNYVREIDLSAYLTTTTNLGIEAIIYDPDNVCFYVTTEKAASEGWKIWQVANDSTVSITALFDLTGELSGNGITDISDGCFKRQSHSILLCSDESEKIIEFGLDGTVYGVTDAPSIFVHLEGIALSANEELMFLTGESSVTPGPDFIVLQSKRGQNPTLDESSHGLNYLQNGLSTSVHGKFYELVDPYSITTNNTYGSVVDGWPVGTRYLHPNMWKRGKKLSFNAYGQFVCTGTSLDQNCGLDFLITDTGNTSLCGNVNITGIPASGTGHWSFVGYTNFRQSDFYSSAQIKITNDSFYKESIFNTAGTISSLDSGFMNFKSRFTITGSDVSGSLSVFSFSENID